VLLRRRLSVTESFCDFIDGRQFLAVDCGGASFQADLSEESHLRSMSMSVFTSEK
jgi:hypothetical protein